MGTEIASDVEIRVYDTTAETRYMVLPQRPAGTEGWSQEQLQEIVTKDCLIGVAVPQVPHRLITPPTRKKHTMDGVHDLAGVQGFGKVPHTVNADIGPTFHAEWEHLPYSLMFAGVAELGAFSVDEVRYVVERMEPRHYMMTPPYYERYVIGVATLMVEKGILTQEELESLAGGGPFPLSRPSESEGRPAPVETTTFEIGQRVRVRDEYVPGAYSNACVLPRTSGNHLSSD